ncbi:MAG: hypothetical protein ACPGGA_01185 [Balneolaceae bacterium]
MSDKPSLDIVLSKFFKKDVFNFMNQFPEEFESIVVLTITDEKPICWRAAWVVQTFMEQDDERVQPYVDAILQIIPQKEDGHQRELLKILAQMNLNDDRESILYDECVAIWESVRKKPGTRYFAFQQMVKMVEKYPELMQEIHAVTQPQHINTLSPGVRQGVVKLIQQLNKDTNI